MNKTNEINIVEDQSTTLNFLKKVSINLVSIVVLSFNNLIKTLSLIFIYIYIEYNLVRLL